MYGIERIHIQSDWNDAYTKISKDCEPTANQLYPAIFSDIGSPLSNDQVSIIPCTKTEAKARYDWQEGIDVIVHFANGTKATMQEKFLTYHTSTMTFETKKSSGADGAWFYCTAQYYFVGYAKRYKSGDNSFQDWMLVDLPALHRIDAATSLNWQQNQNRHLGRRAEFKYLLFDDVPKACVIARKRDRPHANQMDLFEGEIL